MNTMSLDVILQIKSINEMNFNLPIPILCWYSIYMYLFQEIPLSEILSVEPTKQQVTESGQSYCFEVRTANVNYYIGEDPDISRGWEVAIKQALMPVTAPKTITLNKDAGGINYYYLAFNFLLSKIPRID